MPNEIVDEIRSVVSEIKNQLKFYQDIGLEDIGAALGSEGAPRAASKPPITLPSAEATEPSLRHVRTDEADIPSEPFTSKQSSAPDATVGLFGESLIEPLHKSVIRRAVVLPVLESKDSSLEVIRDDIGNCTRCRLHEHRTTIVFGEGDPKARLVFVGEGPGAEEDASGRPFVGRAGQLLDKIIMAIGMKRQDVYIANIVKCRPPGNRTPERDEVDTCEPFLLRQLAFIHPEVIVALGSPAFQCLLRTREPITKARGHWRDWNGVRVMPTFHPAFLLRSPDKKREVWEDMKMVRDFLNENAE